MNQNYVYSDCGKPYIKDNQQNNVCTFHMGECDVCYHEKLVTHIRNYNYLEL